MVGVCHEKNMVSVLLKMKSISGNDKLMREAAAVMDMQFFLKKSDEGEWI